VNPIPKHVLVAGATGYLGRHVVAACKRRGYRVRALARSAGKLDGQDDPPEEIFEGQVTEPETLSGVCDGIDVVFPSVGITRQKDGLTFRDVDYQGNLNLLAEAKRAGVRRFVYVSVFNGPALTHLDIVRAHEDFVSELKSSGLDHAVIRPTGYFSDMEELLKMARKGRVWLVGSGENRMNPIHGADLAEVCVDAMDAGTSEIDVGGPEIITQGQAAEKAFQALGKPPKITKVPGWLMRAVVRLTRLFSRHQAGLLDFFTTMMLNDVVAPRYGERTLADHYGRACLTEGGQGRAGMETREQEGKGSWSPS
jgi:uncharacterized protein YbjT (DUF2867 family)